MSLVRPRLLSLAVIAASLFVLSAVPAGAQTMENIFVGDGPVHFNLRTNAVVADSAVTDDNWDFVMDGVDIRPNRVGILLEAAFDAVSEAPADGLVSAGMSTKSGGQWYDYDQDSHFLWAIPDRTFVFELADDTVAKVEILSYYHSTTEDPRYATFRFAHQPDGSRSF